MFFGFSSLEIVSDFDKSGLNGILWIMFGDEVILVQVEE